MPRVNPIQNSFNSGELSPKMFGRTDLDRYKSASKTVRNWQIIPQGGLLRRSGFRFVRELADSTKKARLHPFTVSDSQAYVLLFEENRIRFFLNEGFLLEQTLSALQPAVDFNSTTDEITSVGHGYADQAGPFRMTSTGTLPAGVLARDYFVLKPKTVSFAPADVNTGTNVITETAHDYSPRQGPFRLDSSIALPGGLLYETDYFIFDAPTANTFQLALTAGGAAVAISSQGTGVHTLTPTPAYSRDSFRFSDVAGGAAVDFTDTGTNLHTWTPTTPAALEIATTYLESQLFDLGFAQSADVLYIVHPEHPPRKLSRFSSAGFFLEDIDFLDGPYQLENPDDAHTIQPSAATGNAITLTSSVAIFKGSDVGRSIRIFDTKWGWAKITAINPIAFTDADIATFTFDAVDVDTGAETITIASGTHGMDTGELVRFKDGGGGLPTNDEGGFNELQDYYVRATSTTVLEFYNTNADAVAQTNTINITGAGGSTNRITSSVIDIVSHGYLGGDGPLQITNTGGAIPDGLVVSTNYFVGFVAANELTLSLSKGGTAVGIDEAQGGGTHTLHGDGTPFATCTASVRHELGGTNAVASWRLGSWSGDPLIGFPRAVGFHEQRLWFAANPGKPETLYGSMSADFEAHSPTGDREVSTADGGIDNTVRAHNAVVFTIGANQVNVIEWIEPIRTLILGTTSAAWTGQAALISEAITPTNFQVKRSSAHGVSKIPPIVVDDRVMYLSDTGLKIFTLGYSFESDAYLSEDASLLAEHITRSKDGSGIVDMDFAHEPWSTIWGPRADGVLLSLTVLREQQILGWAQHEIGGTFVETFDRSFVPADVNVGSDTITDASHGLDTGDLVRFKTGLVINDILPTPLLEDTDYWVRVVDSNTLSIYETQDDAFADANTLNITAVGVGTSTFGKGGCSIVESVAVIPSPPGDASLVGRDNRPYDQLWITVKRTIGGVTKRYVEFAEDHFEDDDVLENAFFVDGGITYNSTPRVEIPDLEHLAGELVDVLADGKVILSQRVSATGTLTLQDTASKVHIGYRYVSDWESLRMPLPDQGGTAEGKQKRVDHVVLRLNDSLGGQFGPNLRSLDELGEFLIPADQAMDDIPPLFSDDIEVPLDAPWETSGSIAVRQNQPLPFTIVAILPVLQTSGRGDRR